MYILVFIASPREIRWALSTTMSRLLLHVAPLAMLATAVHLFEWMDAQPRDFGRSTDPGADVTAGA